MDEDERGKGGMAEEGMDSLDFNTTTPYSQKLKPKKDFPI